MQVQQHFEEFERIGAEIIVVSFAEPQRLRKYLQARPWPFPVRTDPNLVLHRLFGLDRAGWLQLLRPRVILRYLWLIARGNRPQMAQEDVHQLGGDFVLDTAGRVVYEYRSRDPADRPDVAALLDAVRRVGGSH